MKEILLMIIFASLIPSISNASFASKLKVKMDIAATDQFYLVYRYGTKKETCEQAEKTKIYFLKTGNTKQYKTWIEIKKEVCNLPLNDFLKNRKVYNDIMEKH